VLIRADFAACARAPARSRKASSVREILLARVLLKQHTRAAWVANG